MGLTEAPMSAFVCWLRVSGSTYPLRPHLPCLVQVRHLLSCVEGIIAEGQIPELEGLHQEPEGQRGVPLWCVISYDLGWDSTSCTLEVHWEVNYLFQVQTGSLPVQGGLGL